MSDITRKAIVVMFPDRKVRIHKVSFQDLARNEAYRLVVEGLTGRFFSPEEYQAVKGELEKLRSLKGRSFKGKHLLVE